MMYKLSVVVPCYNEEKSLPQLVEGFSESISSNDIELLLVNNGSTDSSLSVMKKLVKKHSYMRIVNVKKNIGYGHGIMTGLKSARGSFVAWTHADLQTPPSDVMKAFDIMEKQPNHQSCYIKGRRRNRPFTDLFFSWGMSFVTSFLLGEWMYDIYAQLNLFHKSFLKKIKNPPANAFLDIYAYYTAKKCELSLIRFPVYFGKRRYGISRNITAKFNFVLDTIKYLLALRSEAKNEKA